MTNCIEKLTKLIRKKWGQRSNPKEYLGGKKLAVYTHKGLVLQPNQYYNNNNSRMQAPR